MSRFVRRAAAGAVVLLAVPSGLPAQAADRAAPVPPYSTHVIGASGVTPPGAAALSSGWASQAGAGVDVYTPFNVCELGAVLRTVRFRSRSAGLPAFRAYIVGLDWRFAVLRPAAVRPMVSVTAGDFLTVYDGDQPKGAGKESEIFVGATAAVAIRLVGATHAAIGVTGMQVLTSTPIRLTYATVGLAHTLATPGWLRGVLQ